MKKVFLIVLSSVFLFSCAPKLVGLKGKYPATPYVIETSHNKEYVWDNVIDLFAQSGISIGVIDKASGIITSTRTKVKPTYEKKDGTLADPNAYVVGVKFLEGGQLIKPLNGTGEWNVRVKEKGGKTYVNVNLVNVKVGYTLAGSKGAFGETDGVSTQAFERMMAESITK